MKFVIVGRAVRPAVIVSVRAASRAACAVIADRIRIVGVVRMSISLVKSSSTFLLGLSSVAIMGLGASMILAGKMTIGDFVAFSLYLSFLVTPVAEMGDVGS